MIFSTDASCVVLTSSKLRLQLVLKTCFILQRFLERGRARTELTYFNMYSLNFKIPGHVEAKKSHRSTEDYTIHAQIKKQVKTF